MGYIGLFVVGKEFADDGFEVIFCLGFPVIVVFLAEYNVYRGGMGASSEVVDVEAGCGGFCRRRLR